MRFKLSVGLVLLAIFPSFSSYAELPGKPWMQKNIIKDESNIWIGLQSTARPTYMGSNDYTYFPIPIIEVETDNDKPSIFIFDSIAGAGVKIVDYHGFFLGASGFWRPGWEAKDDLEGLNDKDGSIEASALMGYENDFGFKALLASSWGFTGDLEGLVVRAKIQQDFQVTPRWLIRPGAQISWGNEEYMDNYFGISEQESAQSTSSLATYDPDSSFTQARIFLRSRYQLQENIRFYTNASMSFILDDAKESPIVKDVGSDITYDVGIGLAFKF